LIVAATVTMLVMITATRAQVAHLGQSIRFGAISMAHKRHPAASVASARPLPRRRHIALQPQPGEAEEWHQ
jgi:hypothetical protein